MKEDYLITIHGTMEQDGESDSVKLMTRGSFVKRNGSFFISYKETEATGYAGCVTTVKVEDSHKVSMLRFGPAPSQLVIERAGGMCHYETGHGSLPGRARTNPQPPFRRGRHRPLQLSADMDTAAVSRNIVKITVKPAN
ncbi:MAG: DUF1934 domain-containing protein [Ruthenibacterium lactatiformans]